jgi:serine/threonine-protein kinase
LEPLIRARWPHSLITWNRLLAGQIKDGRLGWHVLFGAALGTVWLYLILSRNYLNMLSGEAPVVSDLDGVVGGLGLVSSVAWTLISSVSITAVSFFALCGLRAVLRRDWIAVTAAALLLTTLNYGAWMSQNLWFDFPLLLVVYLGMAATLLRLGMVPAIVAVFTVNTVTRAVPSHDFTAFYNTNAVLQIAICCAIAIYAYRISQSPGDHALSDASMLRQGRATAV